MLVKVEVEPEEERVDGKVGSKQRDERSTLIEHIVQEGINTKNKQQSKGIFEDLMKTLSKQEKQRNLVQ